MTHGSWAGEVRDPIPVRLWQLGLFFAGSDEEFGSSPRGVENTRAFLSTCLPDERNRAQEVDWT